MDLKAKWIRTVTTVIVAVASFTGAAPGGAQEANVVRLTLARMVDLALSNSFQVRQLNMSIDRTRLSLQAQRAATEVVDRVECVGAGHGLLVAVGRARTASRR